MQSNTVYDRRAIPTNRDFHTSPYRNYGTEMSRTRLLRKFVVAGILRDRTLQFGQRQRLALEFDDGHRRVKRNDSLDTFDTVQCTFDMRTAMAAHHALDSVLFFHGYDFFCCRHLLRRGSAWSGNLFRRTAAALKSQAVEHDAHAAEGHGCRPDHRVEHEAAQRVKHTGSHRHAHGIVEKGPEEVLANGSDCQGATGA